MFKRFCLTIWKEEPLKFNATQMHYLVYQQEVAPSTGKKHWQTYVEFRCKKSRDTVRTYLAKHGCENAHFEACGGTAEQNLKYCSKSETSIEDTFKEFGTPMEISQGKRTDLHEIVERLSQNDKIENILVDIPASMKYIGHMEKAKAYLDKKNQIGTRPLHVTYIYGPPGIGKSREVFDRIKDEDYYVPLVQGNNIWFDGYSGEKTIWIDDVDLQKFEREFILRLLDVYPLKLPIKGGCVQAQYTQVYLTSNHELPSGKEFRRRIHTYELYKQPTFIEPHPDYQQAELDYLSSLCIEGNGCDSK